MFGGPNHLIRNGAPRFDQGEAHLMSVDGDESVVDLVQVSGLRDWGLGFRIENLRSRVRV